MDRITKRDLAWACEWATVAGQRAGVLSEGETVQAVVAWSMNYLAIVDPISGGCREISPCGTTRELYRGARAFDNAWQMSARVVEGRI